MSIDLTVLKLLYRLRARLGGTEPRRLLSFGYPDALIRRQDLEAFIGQEAYAHLRWRNDSESVLRWHGLAGQLDALPDSDSLFRAIGFDLEYSDIAMARGGERILDLNEPLPSSMAGQYDVIYDGGTLEHCCNVAQGFKNAAMACKLGGYVVNVNPMNVYNHGFFNFSPTFYADFYGENGFQILDIVMMHGHYGTLNAPVTVRLDPYRRFAHAPDNATIMAVVQKMQAREIAWPVQRKYRLSPTLRG
ncbi:MAG: hypothetical protein HYV18_04055 [Gammaproteobacteria bacterium]|nr:hypothetical protein [Gammaproteobacteria bacterium]